MSDDPIEPAIRTSPLGPINRYTVAVTIGPTHEVCQYRVVTALGELKAAAVAAARAVREKNLGIGEIRIVRVEDRFEIGADDLLDYWGGMD